MKILAIDSSTNVASCAIMDDERLLGESIINDKVTHSQKLLPLIADTLNRCRLKVEDIDIFAVSNGPGSFTGLRIGIVTANSLAQAMDKPVVGVSSLQVIAENVSQSEKLIVPIIDARRDRVFTAIYTSQEGKLKVVQEPDVMELKTLLEILDKRSKELLFVGEGVNKYREMISDHMGSRSYFANDNQNISRASCVAEIALVKAQNGESSTYFELTPDYLRESQAQREYDEKMKKEKC